MCLDWIIESGNLPKDCCLYCNGSVVFYLDGQQDRIIIFEKHHCIWSTVMLTYSVTDVDIFDPHRHSCIAEIPAAESYQITPKTVVIIPPSHQITSYVRQGTTHKQFLLFLTFFRFFFIFFFIFFPEISGFLTSRVFFLCSFNMFF